MASGFPANGIRVYISSVSLNMDVKNKQHRMIGVLQAKKIPFEEVDIAQDKVARRLLHIICKNDHVVPPVITKGDEYIGDFTSFMLAVDDEVLEKYLKLS